MWEMRCRYLRLVLGLGKFSTPNEELQFSINSSRRAPFPPSPLPTSSAYFSLGRNWHAVALLLLLLLLLRCSDVTTRPWSTANGNRYRHIQCARAELSSYQQQHQGAINAKIITKADCKKKNELQVKRKINKSIGKCKIANCNLYFACCRHVATGAAADDASVNAWPRPLYKQRCHLSYTAPFLDRSRSVSRG